MTARPCLTLLLTAMLVTGCAAPRQAANPPAPGFRLHESDVRAVVIADQVMHRMGGRDAWDRTRYLRWNFFGSRLHVWDRHTNRIRIEGRRREDDARYVVLMDLDDRSGSVWIDGKEVGDDAERSDLLDKGYDAWVNDSYWLIMPYKLKDSGVRLRYLDQRRMLDGRTADKLELTFRDVGNTPNNKYHVYVALDTGLIEQWDFFGSASDREPQFRTRWADWRRYGSIMLSGDRGEYQLTRIAVLDEMPDDVFQAPDPIEWPR